MPDHMMVVLNLCGSARVSNPTDVVKRILDAEHRVNVLTRALRGGEVHTLIQKSRGILVEELSNLGISPDDAYDILVGCFENPHFPQGTDRALAFLEHCID
jgi:hypothetical protein